MVVKEANIYCACTCSMMEKVEDRSSSYERAKNLWSFVSILYVDVSQLTNSLQGRAQICKIRLVS